MEQPAALEEEEEEEEDGELEQSDPCWLNPSVTGHILKENEDFRLRVGTFQNILQQ